MARLLARGPKAPAAPARPTTIEQLAEYFDVPLDLGSAKTKYGRALDGVSPMAWEATTLQYLKELEAQMFGVPGVEPVGLLRRECP